MQASKRYLLIVTSVLVVFTAVLALSPSAARAANNAIQSVLVTNTPSNPVPVLPVGPTSVQGQVNVTGNVGITGTPSVNIAGAPSVTVANAPNVSVVNTPTVNIGGMPSVAVSSLPAITGSVTDTDNGDRQPFQATVTINPLTNFNYTQIPIPAGKRLVVDFVSMSGAAASAGGPIQPIIILNSSVGGGSNNLFYFGPNQSTTVSGQYYDHSQVKIYADQLYVGPAFSGFSPSFMIFNVVVSGHLITP